MLFICKQNQIHSAHRCFSPPNLGGKQVLPPQISEAWGGSVPPQIPEAWGGSSPPSWGGTADFAENLPPKRLGGNGFWAFWRRSPPKWGCSPPKSWGGTKKFGGERLLEKVVPPQNLRPWGGSTLFPPRIQGSGGAVPISFPPSVWGVKSIYALHKGDLLVIL